jgi:methyl-accepting chemotaxis protein
VKKRVHPVSAQKFGILFKIMLTSVPVLLAFGGFCAYSGYSLSHLMAQFATVNGTWKEATVAAGNENRVLAMRTSAGGFLTTGNQERFKAAMQQAEQIGAGLARDESATANENSRRLLQEARAALDEFTAGLNELAQLQAERSRVLQQSLLAPAAAIDKTLAEMMQTSYHEGDAATAFQAGTAIAGLAQVRGAIQLFLQTADAKVAQDVSAGLNAMAENTALIAANSTSRFIKKQAAATDKLRLELGNGFHTLMDVTARRDKLMDEVINKRADRLLSLFTSFRLQSETASERATAEAQLQSAAALKLNVISALAGAAAALALSFLIGRSIAGPVTALAGVTHRLSGGDQGVEVPFTGRHDEVGEMANALQVFKQNAAQLERMRAEKAQMEDAARKARSQEMRQLAGQFETAVGGIVESVSSAAAELEAAAGSLMGAASQALHHSGDVTAASGNAAKNVESIAAAAEQLSAAIGEISCHVNDSSRIAADAVDQARQTSERMQGLSDAASRIGEVVDSISAIAGQTNLLALNATIEAARAGEAGRGFAVVAQEVKALAAETAKATGNITAQIQGIQLATADSVEAIKAITATIDRVAEIAGSVAAAITEQEAATQEISQNAIKAVKCTSQVASDIVEVNQGASNTGSSATQVHSSAKSLSGEASHLKIETERFLHTVLNAA